MDATETIAVVISVVNFVVLFLNYVAAPVRTMRKKGEDLLVEIVRLEERLSRIELNLGLRKWDHK